MEHDQQETGSLGIVSVNDLMENLFSFGKVILRNWWKIALFMVAGGIGGLVFSLLKKPVYTAESSFVVESKGGNSALSSYAGIASQFGINLLGGEGNDLFQSSNIMQLMMSRNLISRTLLSKVKFPGGDSILADRFMDVYNLKDKWKPFPELNGVRFQDQVSHLNVHHYDALRRMYDIILKNNLSVDKDKKSEIISLRIFTENEYLSKLICENLIQQVSEFYVETKTKKTKTTLGMLQKKTDSVRGLLFGNIEGLAESMDANANLIRQKAEVGNKLRTIRISALQALYSDLNKNLEATKLDLINETPLIQFVDTPILPLEKTKISKLLATLIGGVAGFFIALAFLQFKKL